MPLASLSIERRRILERYFRDLETVLHDAGVHDRYPDLLAQLGLRAADLSDPHARVGFDHYFDALRIVESWNRIPGLGFRLGALKRCGTFGVAAVPFLTQRTIKDVQEFGVRVFEFCCGHVLRLEVTVEQEWIVNRYHASPASQALNVALIEQMVLTGKQTISEALPGMDWSLCEARFAYPEPAWSGSYAGHLGMPHSFDRTFNELRVPSAWGDMPSVLADDTVREFCDLRLETMLAEEFGRTYLERQIRSVLLDQDATGMPRLRDVAARLETTERSLRARLAADGSSFREIASDVITVRAKRFLANPHLSIKEIAFLLGFAQPSSFSRAFAKSTGRTAEEYRTAVLAAAKTSPPPKMTRESSDLSSPS